MPGLLDLLPELIEQIFDNCEGVAYEDEEWCTGNDEDDYCPRKVEFRLFALLAGMLSAPPAAAFLRSIWATGVRRLKTEAREQA